MGDPSFHNTVSSSGRLVKIRSRPEEQKGISSDNVDSQTLLGAVTPVVTLHLLSSIGEDSLPALLDCCQVHQHGSHSLAAVAFLWVDRVMKIIMMWFILLAIDIMEDLQAFTIVLWDVRHLEDMSLSVICHMCISSATVVTQHPHNFLQLATDNCG